jgi:hypothetical protein
MSRALPPKVLREIRTALACVPRNDSPFALVVDRLVAKIDSALQPPRGLSKRKAAKREKTQQSIDETKAIRAALELRAKDLCEFCGYGFVDGDDQVDHFWGRAKAKQTERNCWLLCSSCHRSKTLNRPSALAWVHAFKTHCDRYGFLTESRKAESKILWLRTRSKQASRAIALAESEEAKP